MVTLFTKILWFRGGTRRGRPRPVPDWLPHEAFMVETSDGARLAARWFPANRPRGTVVFAHPDRRYAQDWFVLSGWIDFAKAQGMNALTFDFPDYGLSEGGTSYYYEHVVAAIREARGRSPSLQIHLVGVSLGAFTAANASRDEPVDTLVLESPYPTFRSWYGAGVVGAILAGFERAFPRTAARIDARGSLRKTRARRILVVASEDDTVTRISLTESVASAAPADRTRMLRLRGPQHLDLFQHSREYRDAVQRLWGAPPIVSGPLTGPAPPATHGVPRIVLDRAGAGVQPRIAARAHHGQGRV